MIYKKMLVLGLALAISTVAAQVTSAAIITSIERRNSSNTSPQIAGPLVEGAIVYVDRTYEYNQIPVALVDAEYIKVANDDKNNPDYELDVTLSQDATLYLLLDNRLGHGDLSGEDGSLWDPSLISAGMSWVIDAGFVDTGEDVVVDEYGTPVDFRWLSVYTKDVSAGTITLLQQYDSADPWMRNMYCVAVIPSPLVGHWKFDEAKEADFVTDSSGHGNDGTIIRTIGEPNRVSGISGNALVFSGVDNYHVEVEHDDSLHSDNITITGWFFLNSLPIGEGAEPPYDEFVNLFFKGDWPDCVPHSQGGEGCSNREYGLWVHQDGYLIFISTPEGTNSQVECLTDDGTIYKETWYHFGAVVSSTDGYMRVYVNGEMKKEEPYDGSEGIHPTTGPLLFGGIDADPEGGDWAYLLFDGLMDEVRIHNRALREDEIKSLYDDEWRCMYELPGDTNHDCVFDLLDLSIMASNWLVNCKGNPVDPTCIYVGP